MRNELILAEDGSGTVVAVLKNGKPLPQSAVNLLNKVRLSGWWYAYPAGTYSNAFGYGAFELTSLEASILKWCNKWELKYNNSAMMPPKGYPVKTFDAMRNLFNKLNPEAWEDLLH